MLMTNLENSHHFFSGLDDIQHPPTSLVFPGEKQHLANGQVGQPTPIFRSKWKSFWMAFQSLHLFDQGSHPTLRKVEPSTKRISLVPEALILYIFLGIP